MRHKQQAHACKSLDWIHMPLDRVAGRGKTAILWHLTATLCMLEPTAEPCKQQPDNTHQASTLCSVAATDKATLCCCASGQLHVKAIALSIQKAPSTTCNSLSKHMCVAMQSGWDMHSELLAMQVEGHWALLDLC